MTEPITDAIGREIHVGDTVAYAQTDKNSGINWNTYVVIGFTPCRVKVSNPTYRGYAWEKDYILLYPSNCIILQEAVPNDQRRHKPVVSCRHLTNKESTHENYPSIPRMDYPAQP